MSTEQDIRFRRLKATARGLWEVLRDAAFAWSDDHAMRKGAALAYYTAFSLAPLLIIAINIAGMVFGKKAARGEIYAQMHALLGPAGARAVQDMIISAGRPGDRIWPTVVGVVTIVVGATSALVELKDGLDQIWNAPTPASWSARRYLADFVRTRLLTIGMILALAFLLLVSLVMSEVLAALSHVWSGDDATSVLLPASSLAFSFALVVALFAMIYKLLPAVRLAWSDVMVGTVVTALLFYIGKHLIGVYLAKGAVTSMYGAAGSLLAVLVWVYYSAQIVLYGAEFTKIYARRFGSHRASEDARAGVPTSRSDRDR